MGVVGVAGRTGEVTRAEVVRAGRRRFLQGDRIDLVAIAAELGIARATVYRWFGGRDQVAGQVLWSLASDTLDGALSRPRAPGAAGLVDALVATLAAITDHPRFQAYLAADPQRAMGVLTGPDSAVAGGFRHRLHTLIATECPAAVSPALPADELAYALVRLAESYCYADILAGRPVEIERARPLFHRLLEAPCDA